MHVERIETSNGRCMSFRDMCNRSRALGQCKCANPVRRRWLFREAVKTFFAKRDEMLGRYRVLEVPWTACAPPQVFARWLIDV
jgi:hypothetical protein